MHHVRAAAEEVYLGQRSLSAACAKHGVTRENAFVQEVCKRLPSGLRLDAASLSLRRVLNLTLSIHEEGCYTEAELRWALECCLAEQLSVREAASLYEPSADTLWRHLRQMRDEDKENPSPAPPSQRVAAHLVLPRGRATPLPPHVERVLVEKAALAAEVGAGWPQRPLCSQARFTAHSIAVTLPEDNAKRQRLLDSPFGPRWAAGACSRAAVPVSLRAPSNLSHKRAAAADPARHAGLIAAIRSRIDELVASGRMTQAEADDPSRFYSCDELGTSESGTTHAHVIAHVGTRRLFRLVGSEKAKE